MNVEKQLARLVEALMPEAKAHTAALTQYVGLVDAWNKKIDLTAAKTPSALVDVLLADSLVLARRELVPEGAHLLDVGAGAGGPAVGLAIVRPDVRVTMVEPIGKRVAFLRTAIGTLGLAPRVTALDGRIDPARPALAGDFTITSARATFAPDEWLAIGSQLAPSVLVFTTGEEPIDARMTLAARHDYRLPGSGATRALFRFDRAFG
jgi:16S rRNA (guanine527-N7)-methyltransferase